MFVCFWPLPVLWHVFPYLMETPGQCVALWTFSSPLLMEGKVLTADQTVFGPFE